MSKNGYSIIEHTADLGVELWAPDLATLYATGARAVCELMGEPDAPGEQVAFGIDSEGVDPEDLLVRLLSDVLAAFELLGHFVADVTDAHVARRGDDWTVHLACTGPTIDRTIERGLMEIKAVTYHGLSLELDDNGARARVIFDL